MNASWPAGPPSSTGANRDRPRLISDLTRRFSIRGAALLAAVAIAASGLSGCTSPSQDSSAPKSAPTSASSDTPSSTGATAVPTDVANDIDLRKNVRLSSCKRIGNGWSASGTATNPDTKPVDYTITVFFTTAKATVVGTGETHVRVDPGDKKSWAVNRKLGAHSKTLCVLRGVG